MMLLDDRLFLRETQTKEPKMIVYSLDNMFVLTTDTPRHPSVSSKHNSIEFFPKKLKAVRYLYGAKIVC